MIAVTHYISPQDYLNIERDNPVRHEYRHGLVHAMAGGTDNHDRIALNLLTLVNLHLGSQPLQLQPYSPGKSRSILTSSSGKASGLTRSDTRGRTSR
jgi:Uma2 family endonuclease